MVMVGVRLVVGGWVVVKGSWVVLKGGWVVVEGGMMEVTQTSRSKQSNNLQYVNDMIQDIFMGDNVYNTAKLPACCLSWRANTNTKFCQYFRRINCSFIGGIISIMYVAAIY